MIDFDCERYHGIDDYIKLIAILRGEDGCPWDMVQTHKSIRQNCLEEAYEVCEAIDEENTEHLKEELGDLLMQIIFHVSIESDAGNFNFDDICDAACRKLINRHPHVFADRVANKGAEAAEVWEIAKRAEHGQKSTADAIDGVAKCLPALWRAQKILRKAEKDGKEPQTDFAAASENYLHIEEKPPQSREEAFGELIFAALAMANRQGIDAELALQKYCNSFAADFRQAENNN